MMLFYLDATAGGLCGAIFEAPFSQTARCVWKDKQLTERPSVDSLSHLLQEGLSASGLTLQNITHLGICHGPGSFTGIKISIAWAYGLSAGALHKIALRGFSSLQLAGQWLFSQDSSNGVQVFLPNTKTHSFLAHFKAGGNSQGELVLVEHSASILLGNPSTTLGMAEDGLKSTAGKTYCVGAEKPGMKTLSLEDFYEYSLLQLERSLQSMDLDVDGKFSTLEPEYLRASSAEEKLKSPLK